MRSLIVLWWLFCSLAQAQVPDTVSRALQKQDIPLEAVSVYVQDLAEQPQSLRPPLLTHQAMVARNPASVMKLLTSYAGLSLLGPHYKWKTEVYVEGSLRDGILTGNLYLKGFGDPNLMTVDFWRLLNNVRQLGVREIRGDLIIDNSYFASKKSPVPFDGELTRAYNASPSALAINLKASSFRFDSNAHSVHIVSEPDLPEIKVKNELKVGKGECAQWRGALSYEVKPMEGGSGVTFTGGFPSNCSDKYLELLVLDENRYTQFLFRKLWGQLGGVWTGVLRVENVPSHALKLFQQDSKSLAQLLIDMNKWSHNLMARHVLLTIAAENKAVPGTEGDGAEVIGQWLHRRGFNFNELLIENGSGLSRVERISAQHLGEMLADAYYSPVMPELLASMPILSLDGTLKKRMLGSALQGRAHLKTGSINGVSALAGYVLGKQGKRYVVVFLVNHERASMAKSAQEALLEWIYVQ